MRQQTLPLIPLATMLVLALGHGWLAQTSFAQHPLETEHELERPRFTPTPGLSPTQTPHPLPTQTPMPFAERRWEEEKELRHTYLFWYQVAGMIALCGVIFAGWRSLAFYRQVQEQMLASYRERLFSADASASISAAMSLSAYPKEAVWLVNRWAEIHREMTRLETQDKEHFENKIKELGMVKQAIQDAINDLQDKPSWGWRFKIDWKRVFWKIHIPIRIHLPFRVTGARLDHRSITIPIGPIRLLGAYMVGGIYSGIDLSRADLTGADFSSANLMGANLSGAKLTSADLSCAILRYANLSRVDLEGTNLTAAALRESILIGANLSEADLRDIKNWQGIKSIAQADITNIKNAPEGFYEWAIKNGAIDFDPQNSDKEEDAPGSFTDRIL